MRLKCHKTQVNRAGMKKKLETNIEDHISQRGIRGARGGIPECLDAHPSPERRVEKINQRQYQVPCRMDMFAHRLAN